LWATVVLMHCYGLPALTYPDPTASITTDYLAVLEHAARESLDATDYAAGANGNSSRSKST
jgi:hypothetical protein